MADLTGLGAVADAAKGILGMFFPDKTVEERDQLAAALSLINAQTNINQAEALSNDPLQHWRGGMGWVCCMAYFWNFVGEPIMVGVSLALGHTLVLPQLDIGPLSTLTLGMLGLGGLHVAERIKTVA